MWRRSNDVAKIVETDATTKGLSKIGFGNNVFLGLFDDNKYVQEQKEMEGKAGGMMPQEDRRKEEKNGVEEKEEGVDFNLKGKSLERVLNYFLDDKKKPDWIIAKIGSVGYKVTEENKKEIRELLKKDEFELVSMREDLVEQLEAQDKDVKDEVVNKVNE